MSNAFKLFVTVLLCSPCVAAQMPAPDATAKAIVLRKSDGELRTRRPRQGVASPTSDFMLKISPRINGSKHLLLGTEEIPPGAVIPKHRHHREDEILLIETGNAHVWLGDKEYDADPGALVFIPAGDWISLKNTGKVNINLVFFWNEPSFEEMMRCASVPKGQKAEPLSREDVKQCYQHGDAELETIQASADTRPEGLR
jgi:mannose-6-phosphate isomerase-like protein (cupin superfamily)